MPDAMPPVPTHLIVGRVRRAHGLRGELVVETLTDAPDAVFAPGRRVFAGTTEGDLEDDTPIEVVRSVPFKGGTLLVCLAAIADRTEAEAWRDRYLLAEIAELEPPGESEAFLHELPGMSVTLVDGTEIGDVVDYYELPQGLIIEVERDGRRVDLPMNDPFVRDIDREARRIVMDLPEGLLD
jgi:16S rRNA processing protein RimM